MYLLNILDNILSFFLTLPILVMVWWHLMVPLICISLMTYKVEHHFMCLLSQKPKASFFSLCVSQHCILANVFFLSFSRHPCSMWKFLGPGVQLELQLPAYATAPARPDPSHICNLQHSWIPNPLSEARDQTCILMYTSWAHYSWAIMGTLPNPFF